MEKYNKVGGWLLLLCVVFTIIDPFATIYKLITNYLAIGNFFDEYKGIKASLIVDNILSIIVTLLSIRAGIALWKIKPNALKIAKNYLRILILYIIVSVLIPFTIDIPLELRNKFVAELINIAIIRGVYIFICYAYLLSSTRVDYTYSS